MSEPYDLHDTYRHRLQLSPHPHRPEQPCTVCGLRGVCRVPCAAALVPVAEGAQAPHRRGPAVNPRDFCVTMAPQDRPRPGRRPAHRRCPPGPLPRAERVLRPGEGHSRDRRRTPPPIAQQRCWCRCHGPHRHVHLLRLGAPWPLPLPAPPCLPPTPTSKRVSVFQSTMRTNAHVGVRIADLAQIALRDCAAGVRSRGRGLRGGQTGGWRRLPKRLGAVTVGYKCH